MRKITRDNTSLGHIVGYDYVRSIQYVIIIRASRLIALRLVVDNRCIFYVLRLQLTAKCNTAISPNVDELHKYVLQLHLTAKCSTSIATLGDELPKYVPKLHLLAECNTSIVTIC